MSIPRENNLAKTFWTHSLCSIVYCIVDLRSSFYCMRGGAKFNNLYTYVITPSPSILAQPQHVQPVIKQYNGRLLAAQI